MDNQRISDKIELQELANKLFMYVDAQQWNKVMMEVLTEKVWFDMQSAGGANLNQLRQKIFVLCGKMDLPI